MIFSRLLACATLFGLSAAHFTITYPPPRGSEHDNQGIAPCGGYNETTTRTPFPLGDAHINLSSGHAANFLVLISFANSPTNIANWTAQDPLVDWVHTAAEDVCFDIDVSAGGYSAATEGANATILVQYVGGDTPLFQCSDVVLSANATIPSNITCSSPIQATGTTGAAGHGGHGTASATATTTPNGAQALAVTVGTLMSAAFALAYSLL